LTTGVRLWPRRRASQRQESGFCSAQRGACVADSGATGSAELDPVEERHSALRAEHGAHPLSRRPTVKRLVGGFCACARPDSTMPGAVPPGFPRGPRAARTREGNGRSAAVVCHGRASVSRGRADDRGVLVCAHLQGEQGALYCAIGSTISAGGLTFFANIQINEIADRYGTCIPHQSSLQGVAAKGLIRRESADQARTSRDRLLGVWRRPR